MPRTSRPIPMDEDPEDRFRRVVAPRVQRALHELDKLLSVANNTNRYAWDEQQARMIVEALRKQVDAVDFALRRPLRRRGATGVRRERFAL